MVKDIMNTRSIAVLYLAGLFIFAVACESDDSVGHQADAAVSIDVAADTAAKDAPAVDADTIKDASTDQSADTATTFACTEAQAKGSQCTGDFSCSNGALACHCEQPAWCYGYKPPADFSTRPKEIVCVNPGPAGCPALRPLVGSACNGEITCTYGSCGFEIARCTNGKWELKGQQVP
jgi:hypothetical protein